MQEIFKEKSTLSIELLFEDELLKKHKSVKEVFLGAHTVGGGIKPER